MSCCKSAVRKRVLSLSLFALGLPLFIYLNAWTVSTSVPLTETLYDSKQNERPA